MAKRRKRSKLQRSLGLTARSEQRKGYTMPTIARIKTALRKKSKEFIINLFMKAFAKLTKTEKIRMLLLIEKGRITSTIRRKTRRKTKAKRKTKRKARFRKGSKEAKAYMAKIRRKRR
jgi:hypothetical protein